MSNRICMIYVLSIVVHLSVGIAFGGEPRGFVYVEKGNIFLKRDGKAIQITASGRDSEPILSPDGRWVAFNREVGDRAKECLENKDLWECSSHQLWIIDIETKTERMLLEPRTDVPADRRQEIIYQFNGKEFSPDSKTIYFITPAWTTSSAIHAVDIDGSDERFVMHGYSFEVVREPLSEKIKNYLTTNLKEDDWRIFPKEKGPELVWKALRDDVIGYLKLERSGFKNIVSPTPIKGGWKGDDGMYHASEGREFWTELTSPDGKEKIPLDNGIW